MPPQARTSPILKTENQIGRQKNDTTEEKKNKSVKKKLPKDKGKKEEKKTKILSRSYEQRARETGPKRDASKRNCAAKTHTACGQIFEGNRQRRPRSISPLSVQARRVTPVACRSSTGFRTLPYK